MDFMACFWVRRSASVLRPMLMYSSRREVVWCRTVSSRRACISCADRSVSAAWSPSTARLLRDDIYLVNAVVRATDAERASFQTLASLQVPTPSGRMVPLSQFATVVEEQEFPIVWRRNRLPTLTVRADVDHSVLPDTVVGALAPRRDRTPVNRAVVAAFALHVAPGRRDDFPRTDAAIACLRLVVAADRQHAVERATARALIGIRRHYPSVRTASILRRRLGSPAGVLQRAMPAGYE